MYKALNYWVFGGFGPARTPYEFIDFAREQGLDGVELTLGDCIPVTVSEEECRKIAAYARERGIGLRTMATGHYGAESLGADDEAERLRAVGFTRKYLQIAAWLGVRTILVVPGSTSVAWDPSRPTVPYGRCWEQSTRSIRELLPVAEELGVTIALENVWMRFLLSPMEWKLFLDQFDSDRVGMYLDLGNCQLYLPAKDYIDLLGRRIKAIHVKNWKGEDCGGGLHGFGDSLETGDVDFKAAFDAIAKTGAEMTFTVEMIPFSRLPDLVLPDRPLAEKVVAELKAMCGPLGKLCAVAVAALAFGGCALTPVAEAPHPKHVVFVGWDGCTGYAITNAVTPNLTRLRENGSWTLKSRSILPSSSSCNWHSILTCSASEQHGYNAWNSTNAVFGAMAVTENGKYPDLFYQYRRAKPDAEIGFFYEWGGMAYTADTTMCSRVEQLAPSNITDRVCDYIKAKKPDFLFVACDRPDHAGHSRGWGSPDYLKDVERLDAELGRILQALEDAGIREDTVIMVSSDHGGKGKGHGGATLSEMERPVVIQGPGIRRNRRMSFVGTVYDTGATLGALLGVEFPSCWIGRPYTEAFE